MEDHFRLFCNSTFESVLRREKVLWKKKWTQFMKASSFTKSPYTFVPLQARIWRACTAVRVIYILSGENITAVYTMSRRRWDQNTTQVANRPYWARAIYVWLLHLTPCCGLSYLNKWNRWRIHFYKYRRVNTVCWEWSQLIWMLNENYLYCEWVKE